MNELKEGADGTRSLTRTLPISIKRLRTFNSLSVDDKENDGTEIESLVDGVRAKKVNSECTGGSIQSVKIWLSFPVGSGGISRRGNPELLMRLTSDDNPMFFFHLKMDEENFRLVKREQGLLVNFSGFPDQMLSLLDKCDPTQKFLQGEEPKFHLVLKVADLANNAFLDVVEWNQFKYLCHLSLNLDCGSDSEVKKYLSDVSQSLKKEIGLLKERNNQIVTASSKELEQLKAKLLEKSEEIETLRNEGRVEKAELIEKFREEISREKDNVLKMQTDLMLKFDAEKAEAEKRCGEMIKQLNNRINELQTESKTLEQKNFRCQAEIADLKRKLKSNENDISILQQELSLSKKQNHKLDNDYHEKQKALSSMQSKLTTLEENSVRKEEQIKSLQENMSVLSNQHSILKAQAANTSSQIEKLNQLNNNLNADLKKANEIIRKFQADLQGCQNKLAIQMKVALEQEKFVSNLSSDLKVQEREAVEKEKLLKSLSEEIKTFKKSNNSLTNKIAELEESNNSKDETITWLNKQIDELKGMSSLARFRQNLAASTKGYAVDKNRDNGSSRPIFAPLTASTEASNHDGSNNINSGNWNKGIGSTSTPVVAGDAQNMISDIRSRMERVAVSNDSSNTSPLSANPDSTAGSNSARQGRVPVWARNTNRRVVLTNADKGPNKGR